MSTTAWEQAREGAAEPLREKLHRLESTIRALDSVVVCFSGGLDSGFLLAVANALLGRQAVGLTATGAALAPEELEAARSFAARMEARHEFVDAGEIRVEGYAANGPDRCFHCKTALYVAAERVRSQLGFASIANGTNLDDLGDYRPGLDAARAARVASPLLEAGLTKSDVRHTARLMGIELWSKPAAACLASRIPYGTRVTPERLQQVGSFEADLHALGFELVRVRYHDRVARIEVAVEDIARAVREEMRGTIVEAGKRHGFSYVTIDLGGYRTGSHNEVLDGRHLKTIP